MTDARSPGGDAARHGRTSREVVRLLSTALADASREIFEPLLVGRTFLLERIVSLGQATPEGEWLCQQRAEWVVLLSGAARLRLADDQRLVELAPGDALLIPPGQRHRVEWTDPARPSIWLALHFDEDA